MEYIHNIYIESIHSKNVFTESESIPLSDSKQEQLRLGKLSFR